MYSIFYLTSTFPIILSYQQPYIPPLSNFNPKFLSVMYIAKFYTFLFHFHLLEEDEKKKNFFKKAEIRENRKYVSNVLSIVHHLWNSLRQNLKTFVDGCRRKGVYDLRYGFKIYDYGSNFKQNFVYCFVILFMPYLFNDMSSVSRITKIT